MIEYNFDTPIIRQGTDFGEPGYLRLNFGCPRPTLAAALNRMASAIEHLPQTFETVGEFCCPA